MLNLARSILIVVFAGFPAVVSFAADPVPEMGSSTEGRWVKRVVRVEVSTSLLRTSGSIRPDSDVVGALERSFANWERFTAFEFQIIWTDRQSISLPGRSGDGVNLITIAPTAENLIALGAQNGEVPAVSRVFVGKRGTMSEVDIALNPTVQFSTDGAFGTYDLESTLTHEIGHLIGLDHSPLVSSTMYPFQTRNGSMPSFTKRSISEDDIAAFRSIYHPDRSGAIKGSVRFDDGGYPERAVIWAEEVVSGRVIRASEIGSRGEFELDGLAAGRFRVFVFSQSDANAKISGEFGEFSVTEGRTIRIDETFKRSISCTEVDAIGFAGRFDNESIILNPSKVIPANFMGGKGDFVFGTSSAGISIRVTGKSEIGPYSQIGDLRILVSSEIGFGEYTISVSQPGCSTVYFPGAVTVDKWTNHWSVYELD